MAKKSHEKDPALCTVEGCFLERSSKLYCQKHHRRNKLYGDPLFLKNKKQGGVCSVDGCENTAIKKGLCDKHYNRKRVHGNVDAVVRERVSPNVSLEDRIINNVKINEETGCWEWQKNTCRGYGKMTYKGVKESVHRLSYSTFVGEIPNNMFVLHSCDNPCCCNPGHLYLGRHKENALDVIRMDRRDKSKNPNLVDKETAIRIFFLLETKSNKEISDIVGVSIQSVSRIRGKLTHQEIYKELPKMVRKIIKFKIGLKGDSSGENNPSSVLSSPEVKELRELYSKGKTCSHLSRKFNVGVTTVRRIVEFKTWNKGVEDVVKEKQILKEKHDSSKRRIHKKRLKFYQERAKHSVVENKKKREEVGSNSLTEKEVIKIKKLLKKGDMTNAEIGKKFGVTSWAISRIKCGKNWKHIEI